MELPCIDKYAPNASGCCCCAPRYDEILYDFRDFFNSVVPQLQTGDVILCSWPNEGFGTQTSRCMSHSRWSHVGVVYRPSESEHLQHRDLMFPHDVHKSRPLMLQMLAPGEMGCRGKPQTGGMDIVDLEVYLKDYVDKFSHMPFPQDPTTSGIMMCAARMLRGVERDAEFYKRIEEVVNRFKDSPFEGSMMKRNVIKSQVDLCQSCLPCFRAKHEVGMLFCSELAGEVYVGARLVSPELEVCEMVPAMWDSTRRLQLMNGGRLTREHVFLGPSTYQERLQFGYPEVQNREQRYSTSDGVFGAGGFWGVETRKPTTHGKVPQQQSMESDLASPLIGSGKV